MTVFKRLLAPTNHGLDHLDGNAAARHDHAHGIGGDIEQALNTRAIIGAFPWKYDGLEASPCRIIAFYDVGDLKVDEYPEAAAELGTGS